MTTGIAGGLVAFGLVVGAVIWGRRGVEVASWLAGFGSFVIAVATLYVTLAAGPSGSTDGRVQRFTGKARGGGQVFQAGRDIHSAGNNRPPKP